MRHHVLVGIVTAWALLAVAKAAPPQSRNGGNAPSDIWGGAHLELQMTAQGASLQFDCAQGEIQEPIQPDAAGSFSVRGTYTPQRGGPVRKDSSPPKQPATYKGTVHGDTMQLEVILTGDQPGPGPFTLTRGKTGHIVLCR